jgi:two-component system chemotaxis response regulator CheY
MRVLVVDGSTGMRRILVSTLKRQGYHEIVEASTGAEGLAALSADPVDLIVTDWLTREGDGLEFVRAARASEPARHVPILMITARATRDNILAAVRAGANGYIVKPFAPDTLRERIEALVGKTASAAKQPVSG